MEQRDRDRHSARFSSATSVNGWLVAILLVVVAVLIYRMSDGRLTSLYDPNAQPRAITPRGDLADDEKAQIELFREASPSVVYIASAEVARDRLSLNLFEIPKGSGSGFIWDEKGHVVTNFHVIQGANLARVTLFDNSMDSTVSFSTSCASIGTPSSIALMYPITTLLCRRSVARIITVARSPGAR